MKLLLAAVIASAVLGLGAAWACPPPPPPPAPMEGESAEAYQARLTAARDADEAARRANALTRQQQLWDESESVVVARITEVTEIGSGPFFYEPETRVRLSPVRTLKGRTRRSSFSLQTRGMTSCGPIGFDVNFGDAGEEFVIFVRSGRPSENTILDGIALSWIQDPRVLELLARR